MGAKNKNSLNKENLTDLLTHLDFYETSNIWTKKYDNGASITVDFNNQTIRYAPVDPMFENGEYPTDSNPANGFVIHRDTTLNFSARENFVCLVCIHLLLKKGYEPRHIVLEPSFQVGHVNKPSYGDILVFDKKYNPLVLIENKTFGSEFSAEWNNMQKDGGQLFSYLGPLRNQLGACENIVLFASEFDDSLVTKSHIITLKDNDKRIAELENPLTFKNTDSPFKVWVQTYAKSFETKGLFEDDIAPYSIGKTKYTLSDLKGLSHAEIRPIYHEFATILRNNAITDFEHSFYILIDLFLCKITDERNNPDDLQFYYKGISRDTPKEYCSRLLKLYKQGKKELFDINVVNKEESDIKQIFEDTNRSLTNGLFNGIKKLFDEIKFYNIKKFNFIDVENKEEFELNFQILIKITALIQDINLSNSETNHFFGDLFEGLLSKNVHQTEGQFFTPLPIVNFIINSLPEFKNSKKIKVLDYACGAGHFLTEFIKTYPKAEVYGIEKSQPLSQVAKIATIINGARNNSHIIFKDALSIINNNEIRYEGFDPESFDCIIANPPYSVKGFLNTLSKKDREQFFLIKFVDDSPLDSRKSIECFFIERAKYFLKNHGILGIVLPSSILTNGELYKKTRELLFENFNILSIVSLGQGTFGSTGTKTIILFAQKVKKNSFGLVESFITKKDYTQYTIHKALDDYLVKQNYNKDDYFALMRDNKLNKNLEEHQVFANYRSNFKRKEITKAKQKEWFKQSSFFDRKIKIKSREYNNLIKDFINSEEYKIYEETEYNEQFISFAREIEKDKLNTFIQISSNNVLVLQSPTDKINNKSNKSKVIEFLGYDWSDRKGDEGIKYIVDNSLDIDRNSVDNNDEDDADISESINSIKYVKTPLYNPNDDYDCTKYAFALRKHIYEQCKNKFSFETEFSEKLKEFFANENDVNLYYSKLSDMLDFSRIKFDKTIELNEIKHQVKIVTKYPLKNLGEIAILQKGKTLTSKNSKEGNVKVVAGGINFAFYHNESNRSANIVTVSASGANAGYVNFWKEPIFASDCTTIQTNSVINTKYIFYFLKSNQHILFGLQKGQAQPHVYSDDLKKIQIPNPPLDIQNSIVSECENIDAEYSCALLNIHELKNKISYLVKNTKGSEKRIGDIGEIRMCKRILKNQTNKINGIPFYKIGTFGGVPDAYISEDLFNLYKDKYHYPKKGEILLSASGTLGKAVVFDGSPSYFQDSNIVWIENDEHIVKNSFLLLAIEQVDWQKYSTNGSTISRLYNDDIKNIRIIVPSLEEQKQIVSHVEKLKSKINNEEKIISAIADKKKAVLDKYLL